MHRATSEGLANRNTFNNKNLRSFVLARAFFAGTQRWGAIWTGDNKADWGHLKIAQPMLLSCGIGGITFIGADVGGFFGNPDAELLIRWYQAAAYQPFFRAHAHIDSKRREPWLFGEEATGHIRNAIVGRYAILPYLYTLFHESSFDGTPVMRPLFVEYPEDTNTYEIQDSFLLGSDLLVTPVTEQGLQNISIYLPNREGELWYDQNSYERYVGGQTITVPTPLSYIPVFQRGGSIVPKKMRIRRSSTQMHTDPLTLFIRLNNNGFAVGHIYIDDGNSFDFQREGLYAYRKIIFATNQDRTHAIINCSAFDHFLAPSLGQVRLGGNYRPVNTIERIQIIGEKTKPTSIKLQSTSSSLPFTVEEKGFSDLNKGVLITTIKKPLNGARLVDDWSIVINY